MGPEWLRAVCSSTERLLRLLKWEKAWIKDPMMQEYCALKGDSPANSFHCCSVFLEVVSAFEGTQLS